MLCIGGAIVLDYWKTVIGLDVVCVRMTEISSRRTSLIFQSPVALITFTRTHQIYPASPMSSTPTVPLWEDIVW